MYAGLSAFLTANRERRDLLLGRRPPRFDDRYREAIDRTDDVFERMALKVEAAEDLFLLVGPPGTGKTSRALRQMVAHGYQDERRQMLLMAYTNRAVDEICQAISGISPAVDYIRVETTLACDERYRERLLTL